MLLPLLLRCKLPLHINEMVCEYQSYHKMLIASLPRRSAVTIDQQIFILGGCHGYFFSTCLILAMLAIIFVTVILSTATPLKRSLDNFPNHSLRFSAGMLPAFYFSVDDHSTRTRIARAASQCVHKIFQLSDLDGS
jgi:hypothetical protein